MSSPKNAQATDSLTRLEKEITETVSSYRSLIQGEEFQNVSKDGRKQLEAIQETETEITLEKVADDMTAVLDKLKQNLSAFKDKTDSFSDVVPQLEQLYAEKPISKMSVPKSNNQKQKNVQKKSDAQSSKVNNSPSNKHVINKANISRNGTPSSPRNSPRNGQPAGVSGSRSVNKGVSRNITLNISKENYSSGAQHQNKTVVTNRPVLTPPDEQATVSSTIYNMGKTIGSSVRRIMASPNQSTQIYSDPLTVLKQEVNLAIKEQKTFTIKGCYPEIRRALLKRGWIEKIHPSCRTKFHEELKKFQVYTIPELLQMLRNKEIAESCKKLVKSKLLADVQVDLFWSFNYEVYKEVSDKIKFTKLNKLRRGAGSFTSKQDAANVPESFEYEWTNFLGNYYKTVHVGNHFKATDSITEGELVRKATYVLEKLKVIWPFLHMDGIMNIWILKPVNSSQGVGIHMCRTLSYVLSVVKNNPNRRYIIQKYIERPLLIYNTKFDIRQWFLVTCTFPLTIWMYSSCYLRFSSQTYNLRKLHESIHLTNNSVQCKYNKNISRDISLPSYNMWDSTRFENFLSDIGYPRAFKETIQPGMTECFITAVVLHQNNLDRRKNTFELFGADFMVTEDFKPWLLEINSNPALHSSTPVTAKMCPMVLEDVIKVVVDYEKNSNASTGGFQLVYRGGRVHSKYPSQIAKPSQVTVQLPLQNVSKPDPSACIKEIGTGIRKTLENLLELVKKEKNQRDNAKSIATMSSFNKVRRNISIETIAWGDTIQTQTSNTVKIEEVVEDKNLSEECQDSEDVKAMMDNSTGLDNDYSPSIFRRLIGKK